MYDDGDELSMCELRLCEVQGQMEMNGQLLNCTPCMEGNHEKCTHNCLCEKDNHGVKIPTLKDGVGLRKEPIQFDQSKHDAQRLDELLDVGIGNNSPDYMMPEIVKLLVTVKKLVSKITIKQTLQELCRRKGYQEDADTWITIAWADPDLFKSLKEICFEIGKERQYVLFDAGQLIEVSWYLMGRYHIKRIELNGNMLFFNDKYYEKNAEALIRRNARGLLLKSKNGDMNEIVKMIEDSCEIITWNDIENHVHLKCLNNGTYDIREGEFVEIWSPDNIILNIIPHDYDPLQSYSMIDGVVSDIIPDKRDRQSYYDSLSVALHPYTGIDFQFGGIGPPGTGKSQICELSIMVLGDDNVSASPIHLVANDLTTQKDVAFKMLNIDMDMSNDTIKNIDVLKRWITQDKFTARGIYEHNTTFRPMARMCFMANDLYEIANNDDAEAIYERTHIIRMDQKFRGSESQINNVIKQVATEDQLNGFCTYLLKNATEIYQKQSIHHPINIDTVKQLWNLHGNRIREFFEVCCEKSDVREDKNDVWNAWIAFANRKDYSIKDKKKFYEIFDEVVGFTPTKTRLGTGEDSRQVYAYSGFRLLREEEIAKKETINLDYTMNDSERCNNFKNRASQAQSSRSSILSLLKINSNHPNKNKINSKIMELLELTEIDE